MGVLPLDVRPGTTRPTLALDGTGTYDVVGTPVPRAELSLVVRRRGGDVQRVPGTCRLDSDGEISVCQAGGVRQRFANDFLEATT